MIHGDMNILSLRLVIAGYHAANYFCADWRSTGQSTLLARVVKLSRIS